MVLTGLAKNLGGPTQIDQLVPLVLTGLAKYFGGPTQIYHLVPLVLTGFAKNFGGPTPFSDKNSQINDTQFLCFKVNHIGAKNGTNLLKNGPFLQIFTKIYFFEKNCYKIC